MGSGTPWWAVLLLVLAGCTAPPAEPVDELDPYEPAEALGYTWAERPTIQVGVERAACAAIGGAAWVVGGVDENGLLSGRSQVFEPALTSARGGTWRQAGGVPHPVHGASLVEAETRLMLVGGYGSEPAQEPSRRVLEYLPIGAGGGIWREQDLLRLPLPLADATVMHADRPMLLGGTHDGATATDQILVWAGGVSPRWQVADEVLGEARADGAYTTSPEDLLVSAGGWSDADRPLQSAWLEDLERGTKQELDGVPTPRVGSAFAVWGERLFLLGGEADGEVVDTVEFFDASDKAWFSVTPLPVPVADACAIVLADGLHIIGGRGASGGAVRQHWVLAEPS